MKSVLFMYADYKLLAEKAFCDLDSEHLQICSVTMVISVILTVTFLFKELIYKNISFRNQ
jgi:hypothetical protein